MQKSTIYGVLSFISGAAISGFTTWLFVKKKYAQIAQDEIDSVKARFTTPKIANKTETADDKKVLAEKSLNKPSLDTLSKTIEKNGYVNYSTSPEPVEEKKPSGKGKTYVITPDEFGEDPEFDTVNLTLYADGILARDENDEIVEAEDIVGDALEQMGTYEDDAVHVVNKELKIYYEILADNRKYEDATKKKPPVDDGEDK